MHTHRPHVSPWPRALLAVTLLAGLLLAAGCTRKPTSGDAGEQTAGAASTGGGTATDTAPAGTTPAGGDTLAAGEPIVFGVILPTSGALAGYGNSTKVGIDLAVKHINEAGGIDGRLLKLELVDNKGDSTESTAAYKKLVSQKVSAVIGPITSNNTKAVALTSKTLRVPVVSPTATNDLVTGLSDWVFRTCFKDSFQGEVVANYAFKDLGLTRAAVFTESGNDYSTGLSASFTARFTALGGEVVTQQKYSKGDTEFGPQLSKIGESGAQIVFVPGYPPDVPLILKQAQVKNVNALFCGSDGWDNDEIISHSGEKIVGGFLVSAFSTDDDRARVREFVAAVKPMLPPDKEPGFFEAQGYDTVMVLAEAARTGTSPEKIREGLLAIRDLELVTSSITIAPNGDADKSAVILEVVKEGDSYSKKFVKTVAGN